MPHVGASTPYGGLGLIALVQRLLHHDGVALGGDRGIAETVSLPETALYVAVAFLAAALAFLVEPLVARSLLPTYGGTSAVWTTALVFFQSVLLFGYTWAHVTSTRLQLRRHVVAQVALVVIALVVLLSGPLAVPSFARAPASAPTALWLILVLTAIVGLPFFALSSASPTTQRWFAALPGGIEPYRLFAASNLGSLIGLVAYPTLVEPNLDLPDQARWWSIGFAAFVALTVGGRGRRRAQGSTARYGGRASRSQRPRRAAGCPGWSSPGSRRRC